MGANDNHGYLKIDNLADRVTIATILFKNGYTVQPVKRRRNRKAYDMYVYYELKSPYAFVAEDAELVAELTQKENTGTTETTSSTEDAERNE